MKNLFLLISIATFNISSLTPTLDELGVKYQTDKSSLWHNYTPTYDACFSNIRNNKLAFLEIGFYYGASAKMWEEYFPNAELFYIDIDPQYEMMKQLSERSHLYKVDQEDVKQLHTFIKDVNIKFDIMLDDGGHTMKQQIISFKTLFPYLKSGGIYIIEDLHCATDDRYYNYEDPSNPETSLEFLMKLAKEIQEIGARTGYTDINKLTPELYEKLSYYQKEIKSIHFFNSLCLIIKR